MNKILTDPDVSKILYCITILEYQLVLLPIMFVRQIHRQLLSMEEIIVSLESTFLKRRVVKGCYDNKTMGL